MGKSRSYQAHVIIVKQSKFGEFDKLLTAFSLEFGKIRAIAKGAYRPGSKLGGNVEPLTYSLIMLARGRNLDIIQQSQCIDGFSSLKSDLWLNSCSLYLLELVDSFTVQNSENKPLFNLLVDTLNTLKTGEMTENILRYFEIIMLNFLGFRPQLYNCVICDSLIQPVVNYFSPSSGGIICPNCRHSDFNSETISVDALKVLRFWQRCDLETAKKVKLKNSLKQEIKIKMQRYIEHLLQREVKSLSWLRTLEMEMLVDNDRESD